MTGQCLCQKTHNGPFFQIVTLSAIDKKLENFEFIFEFKIALNFDFIFEIFVNFEFNFEFFLSISSVLSMTDEVNINKS